MRKLSKKEHRLRHITTFLCCNTGLYDGFKLTMVISVLAQ